MKSLSGIICLIIILFPAAQSSAYAQLTDTLSKNHYYSEEILQSEYLSLYNSWSLVNISGGFGGNGYEADFNRLTIDSIGIFRIYRNDSLFIYGELKVLEQNDELLYLEFVADTVTGNIAFWDMKKYVELSDQALYLIAPCCDRYNYNFVLDTRSQIVHIPDTAFLHALIEEGVDTDEDSLISYAEAETVEVLDLIDRGISDITGIEAFVNLDSLWCQTNSFASLDMSGNPHLRFLNCGGYQLAVRSIEELIISNNPVLETLNCSNTDINSLDLTKNAHLKHLDCSSTDLIHLDLSNNTELEELNFDYCDLTYLDISQNYNLKVINLRGTNTLNQLCVWILPFPPERVSIDTTGSPNVYFTTECRFGIKDTIPPRITIISPVQDEFIFSNFSFPEVHIVIDEPNLKQAQLSLDRGSTWLYFGRDTLYTDTKLSEGEYVLLVRAEDIAGNISEDSISFIFTHIDVEAIQVPRNLTASNVTMTSIDLNWYYNESGICIDWCYLVFVDDVLVDTSFSTSYTLTQRNKGTTYSIAVSALASCYRGSYIRSQKSETIQITTLYHPVGNRENFTDAIEEVNIYPNPCSEQLYIEVEEQREHHIHISDLNGKVIWCKDLKTPGCQIDLSSLHKGIYIITIRSMEIIAKRKIIKL